MLGDVEETIYVVEDDDDETDELKVSRSLSVKLPRGVANPVQTVNRKSEMLFVRGMTPVIRSYVTLLTDHTGDSVVLISPYSGA